MKNQSNKRLLKFSLACALAACISILFFMFFYKFGDISAGARKIVNILMPIIYGAVIAYILTPLCRKFEKLFGKKFKPKTANVLAIICSVAIALLIIGLLIALVIPQFLTSVMTIAKTLPDQMEQTGNSISEWLQKYPEAQQYFDQYYDTLVEKIDKFFDNDFLPWVSTALSKFAVSVWAVVTVFKNLLIGFIVSIYILGRRRQFAVQANMLLYGLFPEKPADMIREEVLFADKMFNGFLVGKIVDSAIIGVLCFIGCAVMGFESPILIAVIIGVTNIIPFFGPFIGAIPCCLLLLLQNPMHAAMFIVFIIVLQQIDGNIIGPKILGNATGVSSFWVLFSILLFGGLWGVVGMIVGVPLFAVIYDIVDKLIDYGLEKHGKMQLRYEYEEEFAEGPKEDIKIFKRKKQD